MNSISNLRPDYTFKVITAGDGAVGKTTMLHRFIEGKFLMDTKLTIGVDIFNKFVSLDDGTVCSLQLWDFGGQERFRFFLDGFVNGANGAFLMFDLTMFSSFKNLDEWLGIVRKNDPNLPVLLLGSKCDLDYKISVDDDLAMDYLRNNALIDYYRVSSKTNYNVDEAFKILVQYLVLKHRESETIKTTNISESNFSF